MVGRIRLRDRLTAAGVGMVALVAVGLGVALPAAHATDAPPVPIATCGQSVATDAVLVKNLVCPGDGVVITGDGVTVDLAGHTLRSSTGLGGGIFIAAPTGATATVEGPGRVKGFARGIDDIPRAAGAALVSSPALASSFRHHVVVSGITFVDNTWGIQVSSDLIDVTNTSIRGTNGIGGLNCLGCIPMGTLTLDSSSIRSTGTALVVAMVSSATVTHSQLRGGSILSAVSSGVGIADSTLRDVQIDCDEAGIKVERSKLVDSPVDVESTCGGRFTGNLIRSTKGGTGLTFGVAGQSFPSSVVGNHFSGWTDAVVLSPFANGLTITDNRFDGNVTGLRTQSCSSGFGSSGVIRNNTLVRNSGDAIHVDCGHWAFGSNRMLRNGGLGIFAAGPTVQVTDEGGNVASGNAAPQCVGVVCVPR